MDVKHEPKDRERRTCPKYYEQ